LREQTITLSHVESSDTVESFRLRLQEREDIQLRPVQQWLVCNGKQMQDGHTLAEYGVQECTTITLCHRRHRRRQRVIELDIEVIDTVGKIKERVEELEGIPVSCQSVYYRAKELDDAYALADENLINIVCQRHEKDEATKTETKAVKRRADTDASGLGKKIKEKPLAEMEAAAEIPAVQRRRLSLNLIGPELGAICPSSCDTDPAI
jgi:hypothetical protein